ncbi:MAG: hypothetical protein IJN46_07320 [Lachnospiraceae bacterium]|nr:hypothetical protein [Lachnospiraceae bacterium]
MYGRYGADHFGKFLIYFSLGVMIINLFARSSLLYWLSLIVLGYAYFRMFSKNTNKRYGENIKYLELKNRVVGWVKGKSFSTSRNQDPTKKIFKCPGCRQKVRVPKGKGTILITCPKCKRQFQKRT